MENRQPPPGPQPPAQQPPAPPAPAFDANAFAQAMGAAFAQALQQFQAQQQPAPQPQPPAANAIVQGPFALAPALARQAVLDYANDPGATKIFAKATEPLTTKFTKKDPNIKVFLNELTTKSATYGWTPLFDIDIGTPANPEVVSLLNRHGKVTQTQCQTQANTYMDLQDRPQQNNYQLYLCISATIDEELKQLMSHCSEEYTVGAANDKLCGVCFTKSLLANVEVDTRATAARIRQGFTHLKATLKERFGEDILAFNEHLKGEVGTLFRRGEESTDLITHLLDAYVSSGDRKFSDYMDRIKDRYEGGENITVQYIMQQAELKFKTIGKDWMAPTSEQETIIALQSQIRILNAGAVKKKTPTGGPNATGRTKPKGKAKVEEVSQRKRRNTIRKKTFTGALAWRSIPPATGAPKTKVVNGFNYHWCSWHAAWNQHTDEECDGNPRNGGATVVDGTEQSEITAALANVGIDDIQEEEEE